MRSIDPGTSYESWRAVARTLLEQGVPPSELLWEAEAGLFASQSAPASSDTRTPSKLVRFKVPKEFVELATSVACHRELSRWALLYQILWRITHGGERNLLSIPCDPDLAQARLLEKNVRREIHKMHAFVRFKNVGENPENERERYVAWFEPDHHIVEAATPFFQKRFANMDWSIFTPKGCAHWDGDHLAFTPGIAQNPVEDPDALEAAWRTYYRSIFNPARLKVKAMQAEMPKRYWKNLPEAECIEELIGESGKRTTHMLEKPLSPVKPAPKNSYLERLKSLPASRQLSE